MDVANYIAPHKITKQFGVTSGSLRLWAEQGKIRCLRPNENGRRVYNVNDIQKCFGIINVEPENKKRICYARVSSSHQREDLERQIEFLREKYPGVEIIKDIASGLNWKRPGFLSLLERVNKGDVSEVVVTYKDRLCRFGFEIIEWILKKSNVKLVVLGKDPEQHDAAKELSDDLLAIITVFAARNNGLRAGTYKRNRKEKDTKEPKN